MPPVMGAAAFIMATMMEVPYLHVAAAAIVPALLYYFAVLVQVHFEAARLGLKGLPRERLPLIVPLLKQRGHLLIPLIGIIYYLIAGFTPLKAAFNGIVITVVVSYFRKETRLTPMKFIDALDGGARGALGVACACATVGIVVGTATLTGLGLSIANAIVKIAGGLMLPTLLLTMVACILLGAGLPTTANFIVTSTMAAPALFKLGVPPMAAYMFVLYFGIAADLSPPVALAAYAGAGIAGDDPMKTGMTAVKLALAGFLVPYIYVFNPMLVLVGVSLKGAFFTILGVIVFGLAALTAMNKEKSSRARMAGAALAGVAALSVAGLVFTEMVPLRYAMALMTALMGVFLLGMSTVGFYKVSMPLWLRGIAMAGALGLLVPGVLSDVTGLSVLVLLHLVQSFREKKSLLAQPRE